MLVCSAVACGGVRWCAVVLVCGAGVVNVVAPRCR